MATSVNVSWGSAKAWPILAVFIGLAGGFVLGRTIKHVPAAESAGEPAEEGRPVAVEHAQPVPEHAVAANRAVVENKPAVVENKPAVVENKPAVVENKPAVVENKPAAVENKPVVANKPATAVTAHKSHAHIVSSPPGA